MQGIAELALDALAAVPPGAEAGGVDLVDADRFARALARCGPALLARVFSEYELAGPRTPAELFGVKESVVKMVGGLTAGAGFRHIEIGAEPGAVTGVRLTGPLAGRLPGARISASAGPVGPIGPVSDGLLLAWAAAVRP